MAEMLQPADGMSAAPSVALRVSQTTMTPPNAKTPQHVSEDELLSPIGKISWSLLAPTLVSAALLAVLFSRIITENWLFILCL
jgi:hypothetical protein